MLKILPYLLIAQMLYLFAAKTYLVINWKLNQDFITEKYCVNKDQLMLDCSGKCYLSSQLQNLEFYESQERKQHPSPKNELEKTNFDWICESDFSQKQLFFSTWSKKSGIFPEQPILEAHIPEIFHPPTV